MRRDKLRIIDCALNGLRVISEEEALERILSAVSPLPPTEVLLTDALDCFAAADSFATMSLPPFDNSAMDGYAVVAESARKDIRLKIVGEQPAGVSRDLSMSAGEAIRIFTGAPMPNGADTVVMQEETQREGNFVLVRTKQISEGDFVREAGADLALGQQIIKRGDRLRPTTLALLASQGIRCVTVGKRAQVAIVTTGDELVAPGKELQAGQIFESNGVMLAALVAKADAELSMRRHCGDNFDALCEVLREATQYDAAVVSGGVSVGERDLVRDALREVGAEIDLWRVALKPGKPFLFGKRDQCRIFGLPGNPVSTFVTFLLFVRPVLLRMMGATEIGLPRARVRLGHEIFGDETRPHYFRGELKDGQFNVVGRQESDALFGLTRANALIRVKAQEKLVAGGEIEVLLLD